MIGLYLFLSYASFVLHVISIPLYMLLTPIYLLLNKKSKFNKNIFLLCALFIWPIIFTFFLSLINQHSIDVTTEVLAYIIHALSFILVSSFIYTNYKKYLKGVEILIILIFSTILLDIFCAAITGKTLIYFLPALEDLFTSGKTNIIPLFGLEIPRIRGLSSEPSHLALMFNFILFVLIMSDRYKSYHLVFLLIVQISTLSISAMPFTMMNLFLIVIKSRSFLGFIFLSFGILSSLLIFYLLGDLIVLIDAAFSKLSGEGASGKGRIAKLILLYEVLTESMFLGKGIDYFVFINGTNTGTYLGIFLIEGGLISLGFLIVIFFILSKNLYNSFGFVQGVTCLLFILLSLLVHSSPFPLLFFLPIIHFLSINTKIRKYHL